MVKESIIVQGAVGSGKSSSAPPRAGAWRRATQAARKKLRDLTEPQERVGRERVTKDPQGNVQAERDVIHTSRVQDLARNAQAAAQVLAVVVPVVTLAAGAMRQANERRKAKLESRRKKALRRKEDKALHKQRMKRTEELNEGARSSGSDTDLMPDVRIGPQTIGGDGATMANLTPGQLRELINRGHVTAVTDPADDKSAFALRSAVSMPTSEVPVRQSTGAQIR